MPSVVGWIWLVVALPLAGFLVNGALSFFRPTAKRTITTVGVGVLVAAFAVALVITLAVATLAGLWNGALVAYVGAASGGIWKTSEGGVNWTPVFEREPAQGLGHRCNAVSGQLLCDRR